MKFPWGDNRRFNSYPTYFKQIFGGRIQKVAVNAGFTCPNRDGTAGTGGCTYCNNSAFNPSYCLPEKSIITQIQEGIDFHKFRYRRAKGYLAYFQPFSNTYAPVDILKQKYEEALSFPGIKGMVIGTRPDCFNEETAKLLQSYSKDNYIIVEFGIESCYDETLIKINRGHTFQKTQEAFELAKRFNLKTGGHLIFGLPGESREKMLHEAAIISSLPVDTMKFHQLQIIKGTRMETEYEKNPENFVFMSLEEYLDFFIEFIEKLSPDIVIERFSGEIPPKFKSGPDWGLIRSEEVLRLFEKELERRDTWQGKYYVAT